MRNSYSFHAAWIILALALLLIAASGVYTTFHVDVPAVRTNTTSSRAPAIKTETIVPGFLHDPVRHGVRYPGPGIEEPPNPATPVRIDPAREGGTKLARQLARATSLKALITPLASNGSFSAPIPSDRPPAHARGSLAETRLIPGYFDNERRIAVIRLDLDPEWNVFHPEAENWADLSGTRNLATGRAVLVGDRFQETDTVTLFTHKAYLLIEIDPVDPKAPIALDIEFTLPFCRHDQEANCQDTATQETFHVYRLIWPTMQSDRYLIEAYRSLAKNFER